MAGGDWGGPRVGNMILGPQRTTEVMRQVLIATAVAYVVQALFGLVFRGGPGELPALIRYAGLVPSKFFSGMLWQPLTSLFLHGGLSHLLGNLFFLWMFGSPVAESLGRRRFLELYVGGGFVGGVLVCLAALALHAMGWNPSWLSWTTPTIGASGAVFGVVAVYCLSFPDRTINLLFVPLVFTARWLLPLEFLTEFGFSAGGVNHVSHLAGALVGWLWLRWMRRSPPPPRPGGRRSHLHVVPKPDDGPVFH
jgi:membrane associated rhomboid family serine protease